MKAVNRIADCQVKLLQAEQRLALAQFYKRNHYKGKAKDTDTIWVMTNFEGQIIGAARFCQQAGFTLLRGVWVDKALRTKGFGSRLLQYLKCIGALEGCYCFPYLHLESFYSKYGFCRVSLVPAPLELVLARYNRQTMQVLLMAQEA